MTPKIVKMREQVIAKHRAGQLQHPDLMAAMPELRDKDAARWCPPEESCGGAA